MWKRVVTGVAWSGGPWKKARAGQDTAKREKNSRAKFRGHQMGSGGGWLQAQLIGARLRGCGQEGARQAGAARKGNYSRGERIACVGAAGQVWRTLCGRARSCRPTL